MNAITTKGAKGAKGAWTRAATGARADAGAGESTGASTSAAADAEVRGKVCGKVRAVAGATGDAKADATTGATPGAMTDAAAPAMARGAAGAMPHAMHHAPPRAANPAPTDAQATDAATSASRPRRPIHPLWVRASHWLNAIAAVTLALSGWRIYDASPIYAGFTFPRGATLGGWLGGALQWHFAAMWLLFFNGVFYLTMSAATGRFKRKFLPLSATGVARDLRDALRGRLSHDDLSVYNAVQRAAYVAAIADLVLLVLSGLVIWKSVQFPLLRELLGGYDNARVVHFWAMAFLVAFFVVHVAMAALVPRSLVAMLHGH
ncbi:hypothetical protein WT60_12160 [Burkholderia sp. MSMB617WGS]|uniref:cytochrome b/b6 domain-containing protein n=1 Tax=Burkholderia sp. MSMB617WGS TaxID=1637831 RepID=UPI00075FC7E0|nr:cytochrome b/b6 domain-containing protein [Burkholderia sp. MSMB617WGS]AOK47511.1 hypothetical protein WT60_12160 [Burkholderia sp. MSMB617WGS]